jgi:hypothetical protein
LKDLAKSVCNLLYKGTDTALDSVIRKLAETEPSRAEFWLAAFGEKMHEES